MLTHLVRSVKLESMNLERMTRLARVAKVHAALSDVTRLRIVELLAAGDASASELATELAIPSNLLAHHLGTLEGAGLVARRRSEGDGRRSYLTLTAHEVRPPALSGPTIHAQRVLFVCTANTARSHLAAAAWRQVSDVPAASAGTHPGDAINPGALATAERHHLDLPLVAPALLADTADPQDLVITVCDRAHEELDGADWAHWSIPDPVRSGADSAFDAALTEITERVTRLAPLVDSTPRPR
jgi:protein-tyrosine-phosphatase/DNA-binding HxlR family transcriptional regulator